MMRTLLSSPLIDGIGSTLSAEMARVMSVMVGAWFTGIAEFSATVNCEFQNSSCEVGLAGTEEALLEKSKGVNKKQLEEAKIDEEKVEDEKNEMSGDSFEFKPAKHNNTAIENSIATAGQMFVSYSAPGCWTFAALPTILRRSDADGHTL